MKVLRLPLIALTSAVAILALTVPALVVAQPTLTIEPGEAGSFDVTDLGSSSGPKGAECSPGGVWGNYVYIGESSGNAIDLIDFSDTMYPFASGSPEIDFPVGMAFGPGPAVDFGTYLYLASYGSGQITRIDPAGTPTTWLAYPNVSDVKFDPTGAYSNELFATEYLGAISTVSSTGVITPFASGGINTSYMRFGPGGAWGTGLYAANNSATPGVGIIQVSSSGVSTLFSGGFSTPEQFDWGTGGAFGTDMFATDYATGEIWRVHSDGTRDLFATVVPGERPAGLVFCGGCLYITSYGGGCWKICETSVPVKPSSWGRVKQQYHSN